ncbi:hypothetical protein ACOMHN_045322 [Nucella lapillus]
MPNETLTQTEGIPIAEDAAIQTKSSDLPDPSQTTQRSQNTEASTHVVVREKTLANDQTKRARQLERLRALIAENRRLKARQTCRRCRRNPVALTFLPCGHFSFCKECGESFDICPLCRKSILADVRTYVS